MLRTQTQALSENLRIPMGHLKWFAAFHNEGHHPHVHLIAYSTVESEGYLTKQGVQKLRSSFAKDIFAQDLLCLYEKQTEHRNRLRSESRDVLAEIVSQINAGGYSNPQLEELLLQLARRLSRAKGKKVYGYLKADVKSIVDSIVDEIAKDNRISTLYDLWYEQRENVLRTYNGDLPERVPLSQNKEFKSVKNAVIQEAMNIVVNHQASKVTEDDMSPVEEVEYGSEDYPADYDDASEKATWWTKKYKQARAFLYGTKKAPPDFTQALALMQAEAMSGNGFAMHDLGKMYLSGLGYDKDEELAQEWFQKALSAFLQEKAIAKKKDYLQYRIGKLYAFGYGVEQDYSKAAGWYGRAVELENPFATYSLGSLYRRGQGVTQSDTDAFRLYTMAATDSKKPNAYAAYELGRMCRDGIGTAVDKTSSDNWFRQAYAGFLAIEENLADDKLYYRLGQMNLTGTGTEVDVPLAKTYFEKAAQLDNVDALYGLGKLHLNKNSVFCAPMKAIEYLMAAAGRGHEFAQYTLGWLLLLGEGVPADVEQALMWLNKAAGKGNQYAEYLLGKTYLKGEPVPQDLNLAAQFLGRSAEKGNCYAQYTLGRAMLDGVLPMPDINDAIQLLTESANKNFAPACYLLGKLYLYGNHVERDLDKAVHFLRVAAEQGNQYAVHLLEKMHSKTEDFSTWLMPGAFRLLRQVSQIIQNEVRPIYQDRRVDRKLRRKINEKKQAQGLRQG